MFEACNYLFNPYIKVTGCVSVCVCLSVSKDLANR